MAAAVLVVMAAGCGSSSRRADPAATTVTTVASMDAPVAADALPGMTPAPAPFTGFDQVKVTIVTADGHVSTPCMLVARTGPTRDRGLMAVTDTSLAGHAGMLFAFPADVTGTFWMKDTLIPLSVVFLDAHGGRISSADMVPCPATVTNCPLYPATAPYRSAIEVPVGQLGSLGLDATDRPKVTVGGRCTT